MSTTFERTCRHCQQPFITPQHRQRYCSPECRTVAQAARQVAYSRQYYEAHRDALNARSAAWRTANAAAHAAYQREYARTHRAERNAYYIAHRQGHPRPRVAGGAMRDPVAIAAYNAAYYVTHRAEIAAQRRAKRQARKGAQ